MKTAEIKITVKDNDIDYKITSAGVTNYELAGMLDYLRHTINQKHYIENVQKDVIQHRTNKKPC